MSHNEPVAALVIIGAEVLSGKVQDANSPYLVQALRGRGVEVVEIRTIGDDVKTIGETVRTLARQVDHVLTTGGIGPTHDDVTIAGVAAAFEAAVVHDRRIEEQLRARIGPDLNAAHLKMAEVPAGARVIVDLEALVPIVQVRNVTIFPGVPALVRWCFTRIAPELAGRPFFTLALLFGVHESSFAEHLADVQRRHPRTRIGSYPRLEPQDVDRPSAGKAPAPCVRVKVTVDAREHALAREAALAIKSGVPAEWIVAEEETAVGAV